ncbi:uncharacterized protein LOC110913288 [Helianthus annuus]|uniref:uncharacterized protein LOC110913288 n=1 Tax=Helianthus annuus TaxID=4232 RepID=UPI000B8F94A1|nr:uncharacterized protein LOC110913288 [Helianthus annuus]
MERGNHTCPSDCNKSDASIVHDRGKPPNSFKGFPNKPLNIDGNSFLPRRGTVQDLHVEPRKINVIDELMKITEPVVEDSLNSDEHVAGETSNSGKGHIPNDNNSMPRSYADSVLNLNTRKVNFRSLSCSEKHDECDIVLPKESVRVVQDKLANTLIGYFLGDRIAYPVVEFFVRNNWKKFGLEKSMMNATGFFFFKFADRKGMMDVLKEGPWIIRSQPIFLNEWSPSMKLEKKEVTKVQVWVKIHEVPLAAYREDGLNMIATTIGEPKHLDSYTASMCIDSWGRSSYARALVELSAEKDLKEEITLAIPVLEGEGFIKETMYVEYEWCPLRCSGCCVFGHSDDMCPKKPRKPMSSVNHEQGGNPVKQGSRKGKEVVKVDADGFSGVHSKKVARKGGIQINKPKSKFEYRPEVNVDKGQSSKSAGGGNVDSEEDEVMEGYSEMDEFLMEGTHRVKGASTPSPDVSNESHVNVENLNKVMHFQLVFKQDKKVFFCSIVYAANYYITGRELWYHLSKHKVLVGNKPWVILGDFNSALNLDDKSMGASNISTGMRDFQDCISELEVFDINSSGLHFTWNQKPKKGAGLLNKIDRVMGNTPFVDMFPNSVALFHPYRLSDHCPCLLKIPMPAKNKHRPFKFANFLVYKPGFIEAVKKVWDTNIEGVQQLQVVKKLRLLKNPLRALVFQQGNLHKKVEELRSRLDAIQRDIDSSPLNAVLREQEMKISADFQEACLDEERFLKQKSKVDWLRAGDANTAFFHASLKSRNHSTRIDVISNNEGVLFEGENVSKAIVAHYEKFLGSEDDIAIRPSHELFSKKLNEGDALYMVRPVTSQEVKLAMFSIGNEKAPGPDGYSAAFFKSAWDIIGVDVSNAIIDFFNTGKLLRELNNTLIVLIPKKTTFFSVTDYRPIACCNVIYKCISKIVADRIKGSLNQIVSINQSAFIPGRKISDNILLTQELMHNYHRSFGPPRCAFKVDIQKAYDTVHWNFLKDVLVRFGFNSRIVDWIMTCVSTPAYSLCVNGEVHGYFKGRRGLRQGDPLSPYLFTLVMETLTCILQHASRLDSSFKFHNKCEKQRNLCHKAFDSYHHVSHKQLITFMQLKLYNQGCSQSF